jgi:hypothetical protein
MTRRTAVVLAFASLAVGAEAGTKFKSTWKPPDAVPVNFRGQKVAALVMLKDEKYRNGLEDELAYALRARGLVAIAAHSIVPPEEMTDKDRARARLEQAGVVGAVVLRGVGKQTQLTETPGSYWVTNYYTFTGYYGWGWGGIYDPGYVRMDNVFVVETLIFDLKADKLLWAALSTSKNPKRVDDFMKDLVSAAAKQLEKEGLVSKP